MPQKRMFRLKITSQKKQIQKPTIIGATCDWGLRIVCAYSDGTIHNYELDRYFNRQYYQNPTDPLEWPMDPKTGEKLPIVRYDKRRKIKDIIKDLLTKLPKITIDRS